jgi:hypothetical protein
MGLWWGTDDSSLSALSMLSCSAGSLQYNRGKLKSASIAACTFATVPWNGGMAYEGEEWIQMCWAQFITACTFVIQCGTT